MLAASGSGFVVRSKVSMRISHLQRMTASATAVTDRQRGGLAPIKDQDAQRQQRYTSRKLPTSAKLPIRHTDAVSQKRVKSRNCLVAKIPIKATISILTSATLQNRNFRN